MAVFFLSLLVLLAGAILSVDGSHFDGGIVTWRATNTTPSGSTAQILVHQRYSWRRSSVACTNTTIVSQTLIGSGSLTCNAGVSCGSFPTTAATIYCTDFSVATDTSSGEKYTTFTLPLNRTFIIGFVGSAWLALAIGGNGAWQVNGKIELTPRADGYLNTSPVTSTLPVIYRTVNVPHVHVVQMSDADVTDTLRCRWSTNNSPVNFNGFDECGSICAPSLPTGYTLFTNNCTLVYTITALNYYAVALQIEDYYTSTSTTPMSSVPLQFLIKGTAAPSGCATAPSIIGNRPNLACIGTPIGNLTTETVVAQVGCPGKAITEFTTSSPTGLIKTAISNPSTGIYTITLLFTPTNNQFGPQGFCAAAVDDSNVQSDSWCITFLVGFTAPNLQTPLFVQGSASPIGTVFANQSVFSIQSVNGVAVNRPSHNGTYIKFNDVTLNGTTVLQYDCGWSPNVIYSGGTIIIYAPYAWVPGHTYYVTFDSGASSGNDFCHAESSPILSPTFWVFDIWNPALSSTTTTTTTAPTTHTVTTRVASTVTPVANQTTTGIVVTTATSVVTVLTTTITTTTTDTTTTTGTTIATTTLMTDVPVMSAQDFVNTCKQTVIIGTVVGSMAMIPLNVLGMFALFTKMDKMFNPHRLAAKARQQRFLRRVGK